MTLDDLKHIFRHQITPPHDDAPVFDKFKYELYETNSKLIKTHAKDDLEGLLPLLDNFVLDGYRADGTVLFVKPEVHIG